VSLSRRSRLSCGNENFKTTEKFYGAVREAQSAATAVHQKLTVGCRKAELVGELASRIRALEREIANKKGAPVAIEAFWREVKEKCPLVEAIDSDDKHLLITFLWRGDATTQQVDVRGGPFATSFNWRVSMGRGLMALIGTDAAR
jgi:hypothetical protein